MAKQRCNVCVHSSSGQSWTTHRGARRLVDRGLASRISSRLVRMIETDHRFACESPAAAAPELPPVIPFPTGWKIERGFLRYPEAGERVALASMRRFRAYAVYA